MEKEAVKNEKENKKVKLTIRERRNIRRNRRSNYGRYPSAGYAFM